MRFEVIYQGRAVRNDDGSLDPDLLQAFLDRVMDELVKLDVDDVSISAVGSTGSVEISVTVDAADADEAVNLGGGDIHSAIHAAGGFTAEWDSATARRAQLAEA